MKTDAKELIWVDPSPLHEKKGVRTSACVVKENKQWAQGKITDK